MLGLLKKIIAPLSAPPKLPPPLKKDFLGTITHYFQKAGAAVVKIKKGPLKPGMEIRIYGKHVDYIQKISSLQIDRKPIKLARKGQEIGLGVRQKVHAGDGIYAVAAPKPQKTK